MRAMIDSLEGRQMFSFSVWTGGLQGNPGNQLVVKASFITTLKVSKTGTLFVSGSAKADTLNIQVKNGKLVSPNGVEAITYTDLKTGAVVVNNVGSTKIKRIDLSGLGGNDTITVIADVPVNVRGAAGDDTLNVFAPTRTISGGSGKDVVREGNELAGDAYKGNTLRVARASSFASPLTARFADGGNAYTVPITVDPWKPAEDTNKPSRTSPRGG